MYNLFLYYITKLPDRLNNITGTLNISHTDITELPKNFTVDGCLILGNTNITKLPDNLRVNGVLDICNTIISELPEDLSVSNFILLNNDKIKIPEECKTRNEFVFL